MYRLSHAVSIITTLAILSFGLEPAAAERQSQISGGQAAIQNLGRKLRQVAEKHELTGRELKALLVRDKALKLDTSNAKEPRLLFVEHSYDNAQSALPLPGEGGSGSEAFSSTDAFTLHSKPGSQRKIFLDFDGTVLSGTVWNNATAYPNVGPTYNAPPFDTDGNNGSFSAAELTQIIQIWQRVAEDYAPFDVDVTTEDPGFEALNRSSASDLTFGTRALITRDPYLRANTCGGCGGVAYINVFDNYPNNTTFQPALVFADGLAYNEKLIGEAASHEVGHNAGLYHDGTTTSSYYYGHGDGVTSWAPIMGVGYHKNVTQWSSGEYPNANNTRDDFATLASNGILFREDDHDDEYGIPTYIGNRRNMVAQGIIEQRSDVDLFEFVADLGNVTIDAVPIFGTNLDLRIVVFSASGQRIAGPVNPAALLTASVSFEAPYYGDYYLRVTGVGFGDLATGYSDYGSLGQYKFNVSVENPGRDGSTLPPNVSVSGPPRP